MHYAVEQNNLEVVKLLLEAGANPNAGTKIGRWWGDSEDTWSMPEGTTPLHGLGDPGSVRLLLDAGAAPRARNEDGRTPFDLAKENEALQGTEAYWLLQED